MEIKSVNKKNQFLNFPGTRYMGSKHKIINEIWNHISDLKFDSILDAFAGSNVVSYFMKCKGKQVITNDFLNFSTTISKAIIENSKIQLNEIDILILLNEKAVNYNNNFIQNNFNGIFFTPEENAFLDRTRSNIELLENEYKKCLALSSLIRACLKKQSRGIFTFVGQRYDDGRKDMKLSLKEHFLTAVDEYNSCVFDNNKNNLSLNIPVENLNHKADLVYLDPPYYSPKSDNDYTRRYHFVEGLCKNWEGLQIVEKSKVKKFKSYNSSFSKEESALNEFNNLFFKYKDSKIIVSYSSNSFPTKENIEGLLSLYKDEVIINEIDHTYSFGNQTKENSNNFVKEYLFIGQ